MFELTLHCAEDAVETISDALDALDALSVSVEDADAQTPAEQALFGEPGMPPPKDGWQRSVIKALFATEVAAREAAALLAAQDFFAGSELLHLDNCFVTPHMIGQTKDVFEAIVPTAINNIRAILDGRLPMYCKNPATEARWRDRLKKIDVMKEGT